ncbi:EamA family transporter [Vibrio parahaemolyticus]|uniref:DMT family transporter n=1 Tax=Vibrio TaxID=662 RepID=UPI000A0FA126|nr:MULTISPECIES: DMT family transporter [Vibrio]EJB8417607.1 EamA family transporter [Vibrio vulnificus]EGQ7972253.1 EamA family transporter [Vibrio parahaemolyticus]EGQ7976368.1 EamA family transporter [Vibrio parahaemolyticus]EGR1579622.1 EamA family transporter [Vibrio parahaemolyticus]EGR1579938.1 EamA family transporter [Vibrio parahaemolyticus]
MLRNCVTSYQFGMLSILFAATLWGTTGTIASLAPNISSLAIGAFSMGVGGIFQVFLSYKSIKKDFLKVITHKKMLILSIVALVVYPLAFYSSMRLAGVAIGTVVSIATAPFFSVLLECLFSKGRKVTKQWAISFVVGVIGIILLVSSEPSSINNAHSDMKLFGVLLGLVAGMTYATYSWGLKTMIDQGVKSQAAMGSIFGFGATLLLPTLFITGDNMFSSPTNIMVLGYMALIPMGVGYIAYGFGLRFVTASSANLLTMFEPVIAAVLAVVIVGESIPSIGWMGIVLILVCLLIQAKN